MRRRVSAEEAQRSGLPQPGAVQRRKRLAVGQEGWFVVGGRVQGWGYPAMPRRAMPGRERLVRGLPVQAAGEAVAVMPRWGRARQPEQGGRGSPETRPAAATAWLQTQSIQ